MVIVGKEEFEGEKKRRRRRFWGFASYCALFLSLFLKLKAERKRGEAADFYANFNFLLGRSSNISCHERRNNSPSGLNHGLNVSQSWCLPSTVVGSEFEEIVELYASQSQQTAAMMMVKLWWWGGEKGRNRENKETTIEYEKSSDCHISEERDCSSRKCWVRRKINTFFSAAHRSQTFVRRRREECLCRRLRYDNCSRDLAHALLCVSCSYLLYMKENLGISNDGDETYAIEEVKRMEM